MVPALARPGHQSKEVAAGIPEIALRDADREEPRAAAILMQ